MENQTKRDKHAIRLLNWIKEHSGLWYLICTPNEEHMNFSMMKTLIEHLAEEQFHEIIIVLIMVHRNADFMDKFFKRLLLETMISAWKGEVKEKEQFIMDMTELLT